MIKPLRRCTSCRKFRQVNHDLPYTAGWVCGRCDDPDELPQGIAGAKAESLPAVTVGPFSLWRPFLVKLALWANR